MNECMYVCTYVCIYNVCLLCIHVYKCIYAHAYIHSTKAVLVRICSHRWIVFWLAHWDLRGGLAWLPSGLRVVEAVRCLKPLPGIRTRPGTCGSCQWVGKAVVFDSYHGFLHHLISFYANIRQIGLSRFRHRDRDRRRWRHHIMCWRHRFPHSSTLRRSQYPRYTGCIT